MACGKGGAVPNFRGSGGMEDSSRHETTGSKQVVLIQIVQYHGT